MSFKKLAGLIWKTNFERAGLGAIFKPVFMKVIGIEDTNDYNNILRFLYKKAEEFTGCVFFADEVPCSQDFDMITYLSGELNYMDISNLSVCDISLFDNSEINKAFLSNLDIIVKMYEEHEGFRNQSVKIDFIVKMMMWMHAYVKPIEQTLLDSTCAKCIYYGSIMPHESYFLLLLYLMGMDVLYINPLRDEMKCLPQLDFIEVMNSQNISQIDNIMDRINNAVDVNLSISTTAQLMDEIQEQIFNDGNVYRPWQLKDHQVSPLKKPITIYDLQNNISEPAKVRDGFRASGNLVYTTNVFFQVDGIPNDLEEYKTLYSKCAQENALVLTDKGQSLISSNLQPDEILQLVFCRIGNGVYDLDELRKLPFYKWRRYHSHVENNLFNAITRTLSSMFQGGLSESDEFNFIGDILSISEDIIKLLDNYDYSDKIPKVVIFLENEDFISERTIRMLCYIFELGFDVVILNPSGLKSISSIVDRGSFSQFRYDKMVYDLTLEQVKKKKPKGFFRSLFQY